MMFVKKMASVEDQRQEQAAQLEKLTQAEVALTDARAKLKTVRKEAESLRGKVQSKDQQLVDMHKATELMHEKVRDLSAVPAKLKTELEGTQASLGEAETKLHIMNEEIASLQSELLNANERLKSSQEQLEDRESGMQDKEIQISTLKEDLAKARTGLEQTGAQLGVAQNESNTKGGQLKSALKSLDEMMKYIETMREENDEVVATLEGDLEKALKVRLSLRFRVFAWYSFLTSPGSLALFR